MELGCFSVSLAVKDLKASKEFYEKIGFSVFHGDENQGWLILKNGQTNLGLFQGMFDKNILTFNPGWNQDAGPLASFTDVRDLFKDFETKGVPVEHQIEPGSTGPASFTAIDPDGNPILFDQHV